jgi:hypothetical protein
LKNYRKGVDILKVKIQRIIMAVSLILIIAAWAMLLCTGSAQVEHKTEQPLQAEPLTITTTPKNTDGTITIYDEHGGVYYQYSGEIDVRSSGWNGKEVDIVVNLPSTGCSCLDEEGNLIQEGEANEQ